MKNIKQTRAQVMAFLLVISIITGLIPAKQAIGLSSNETIVYSESDFKTALQNSSITTIYFGADIKLTSRVTIAKRANGTLMINGTDPTTGVRHQYEDHFVSGGASLQSNVSLYMSSSALTKEVIFKDIDLLGYNIYGVITCGSFGSDVFTVVFDNVVGTYNEFVALYASTFIIRDSVLTVSNSGTDTRAEEVAEVNTLIFEGNNVMHHNNNTSYAAFSFYSSSKGEIIVREDANVLLQTNNNAYGCFYFSVSNRTFTMEKNSIFTYIGRDRFSIGDDQGRLDSFTIGEGAAATLVMHENDTQSHTPGALNADTVTVDKGGSLSILSNTGNTTYTPLKTNSLILNNPKRVVLLNQGTSNVIQAATALNGTGIKSIRYYASAGSSYDFGSYSYNDSRSDYSKWFFQEAGSFDVSASSWGATAVTGLSSTYSAGGSYDVMSASNLGVSGIKVIQIDGGASQAPEVYSVVEGMTEITGKGVPGALITVTAAHTGRVITTTVGDDGAWTAASETAFIRNDVLSVTQAEVLYNASLSASEQVETVVLGKRAYLLANNNTEKTYAADILTAVVNTNEMTDFTVNKVEYVIFDDPDEVFDVANSSQFDTAFAAAAEGKSGEATHLSYSAANSEYKVTIGEIQYNCAVWMRATMEIEGNTVAAFDKLSYRNLYTSYTIKARGVIAEYLPEIDVLYDYKELEGKYGFPYMGDGETIYESALSGFDTVDLVIDPYYQSYWMAKLKDENTPYTLTLDHDFIANNTLCDNNDPSKYTLYCTKIDNMWWHDAAVKYCTKEGNPVSFSGSSQGTISVPLTDEGKIASTDFYTLGGRYTPPSDDDYNPVGWAVDDTFAGGVYNEQGNFALSSFNPQFSDVTAQKLFIIYKTDQFELIERFYNESGHALANDRITVYDSGSPSDYNGSPAYISGYVPVSYKVSGSSNGDRIYIFNFNNFKDSEAANANQYDLFPGLHISGADLIPATTSGSALILYTYAEDANENGIPDSEETTVTARWRGYMVNNSSPFAIQNPQTIYSRINYMLTITNKYPEAADDAHLITYEGVRWMFDQGLVGNASSRSIMMDGSQDTVAFGYGISTDGTALDKRQYVTERFYTLGAGEDNKTDKGSFISGQTEKVHYILKTETYDKTPPVIDGYVYVGYRLEDETGDPIHISGDKITTGDINTITYKNGGAPENVVVSISSHPERYTMIYLYREAAQPVAVAWLGTTFAGNNIALGTTVINGYVGEKAVFNYEDQNVGEYWQLSGAYILTNGQWVSQTNANELAFTLGREAQQYGRFAYKEASGNVTVTVLYKSDDDNINISFKNDTVNIGNPVSVSAFKLSGYELSGWTLIDSLGNEIESGGADNVPQTVDPAKGMQTLTIMYKSVLTSLFIRCYDSATGQEIADTAQKIENINVGDTHCAVARALNGYTLAGGEELTKGIAVQSGTNTIIFYYEGITGGTLVLREAVYEEGGSTPLEGEGRVIEYRNLSMAEGEPTPIPSLLEYYYDTASYNAENYEEGKIITYYYKKQMMDVKLRAVDKSDPSLELGYKTLVTEARKGEMYQAVTDLTVLGYSLSDSTSKYVYADPSAGNNTLLVPFTYQADQIGDVTIRYYYIENGEKIELNGITVQSTVGSKLTASGQTFEGFELAEGESLSKEITVTEGANEISFLHTDVRKAVTVSHYLVDSLDNEVLDSQETYRFAASSEVTRSVTPKHVNGYVLAGYRMEGGTYREVSLGAIDVSIGYVTGDMQVKLYYKAREVVIEEHFATIHISGETQAGGSLYTDTMNVPINSGEYTITAHTITGYALADVIVNGQSWEDNSGSVHVTAYEDDITLAFIYRSLETQVMIRIMNGDNNSDIIPGYGINAIAGQPFTHNAPDLYGATGQYYYLDRQESDNPDLSSTIGRIDQVAEDGSSEIVFFYRNVPSEVIFVAKEDDTNGSVIVMWWADTTEYIPNHVYEEPVRILSDDYYTYVGNNSVYTGDTAIASGAALILTGYSDGDMIKYSYFLEAVPKIIEVYYRKETMDIPIIAKETDANGTMLDNTQAWENARMGEAALVEAPVISGYTISGDSYRRVMAVPGAEAEFYYAVDEGEAVLGRLTVIVLSAATGTAIANANVTVANATDNTVVEALTDHNGKVELQNVAFSDYKITAAASGYINGTATKTVSSAQPDASVFIALGKTTATTTPTTPGGGVSGGGSAGAVGTSTKTAYMTIEGHDEEGNVIYAETVEKTIGSVVTVTARQLDGYILSDAETKKLTIAKDSSENLVVFYFITLNMETGEHMRYIRGYEDGTVRPDNSITRAEAAAIFFLLVNDDDKNMPLRSSFIDVNADVWYGQSVAYLEKQGVLTGYPEGIFKPDGFITRAEFAALASQYYDQELWDGIHIFNDVPNEHWAAPYIRNASAKEWIIGYQDGSFKPEKHITRAEAVSIINNMLDRKIRNEDISEDIPPYTDLDATHWGYSAIIEASFSHGYERKEDGWEIWGSLV